MRTAGHAEKTEIFKRAIQASISLDHPFVVIHYESGRNRLILPAGGHYQFPATAAKCRKIARTGVERGRIFADETGYFMFADAPPGRLGYPKTVEIRPEICDSHLVHARHQIRSRSISVEHAPAVDTQRGVYRLEPPEFVTLPERRALLRRQSQKTVDLRLGKTRIRKRGSRVRLRIALAPELDGGVCDQPHFVGGEKQPSVLVMRLTVKMPAADFHRHCIVVGQMRDYPVIVRRKTDRLAHRLTAAGRAAVEVAAFRRHTIECRRDALAVYCHQMCCAPIKILPCRICPTFRRRPSTIGDPAGAEIRRHRRIAVCRKSAQPRN